MYVLYSRLQRNNINQYWIPSTTKISPDLGCYIQNKLGQLLTKEKCTTGDRSRLLFAYLCVSKVIRATKVCALQVNCFLVMVITSHLCKETLTETQGQSGYQRSESKLCFLMMTKTHNDWHINHYYKDFFVTIFQKMENFEEKKWIF